MNDIYQTVVVFVFCCTLWVHCCLKQCLQWMLGTSNRFCCMLILFDRWKPFWQHVVTFFLNGAASLPFFHLDHVYLTLFVCFSFIICGWLQFTRGNIVDMRCGSTQVKCFAALTWPWRSFQPYDVAQPQIMSEAGATDSFADGEPYGMKRTPWHFLCSPTSATGTARFTPTL